MSVRAESGFSLVELLVASVITLLLVGSALALMNPAQQLFQSQPEASDVQQRVRVAEDALRRDIVMAGAGSYAGPAPGTLTSYLPSLMPYRAFGTAADPSGGVRFRRDAISFVYVPATASQTTLATALATGASDLDLLTPPNCPPISAAQVCGFGAGDRLMVFGGDGSWDVFTVDQIVNGLVRVDHLGPSASSFAAGSLVTEIEVGTYYRRDDPSTGLTQLIRYDGWVTDLPVVDDVVALEFRYFGEASPPLLTGVPLDDPEGPWTTYGPAPPLIGVARGTWPPGENCTFDVVNGGHRARLAGLGNGGLALVELDAAVLTDGPWCPDASATNRFDADLLRVRRVSVSLRVQSAVPSLRGPAGVLFLRGGTARAGARYVPDLAVQFDVTPRNLNLAR